METGRKIVWFSALTIFCCSVVYVVTGLAWILFGRDPARGRLSPSDPYLAILEALIVLTAPFMVALMAGKGGSSRAACC